MLAKIIKPGDKLELQQVERVKMGKQEEAEVKKIYRSAVSEILSEDSMEITMPLEQGKLVLLQVDSVYDIYFYTANGLYQCFARVVDRYKTNNIYLIQVELISNLRKQQRREYYRFSCSIEMQTAEVTADEFENAKDNNEMVYLAPKNLKKGVIVDISGGGLRFIIDEKYEVDSLISCKYRLVVKGKEKEYNLVGRVLSARELGNRPGVFEHRIQFQNINIEQREEIIRYIFQEERKNRKKEQGF